MQSVPVMNANRALVILLALALPSLSSGCRVQRVRDKTSNAYAGTIMPSLQAPAPPALAVITRLRGPESVLYDREQDVYFISNMNGGLLTADDNGFISRVNPDSMAVELKWIEGGKKGVRLDAPKGMGIVGNTLYVSDVTAVRKFDRRTGAPLGEIALPGATLINDIAVDGNSVYVSDTGLRQGPGTTFIPTCTDAVWKVTNDHAQKIASGATLDHPNGLDVADGRLRVVAFGGTALYEIDGGKRKDLGSLPGGQLDGLLHLDDGDVLVTSWRANEIYRGPAGGPYRAVLAGVVTPADIGYDSKRHRLLLPSSAANTVSIHAVP